MRSASESALIAVVDDRALRRAMLVNFLVARQQMRRIVVQEVATIETLADFDARQCDMFLVSLGGVSLRDPRSELILGLITDIRPDCPVVVLSDIDTDEEARVAHDRGARGFIPTRMEPDIMLAALNFILSGGSYFPPECIERADKPSAPRGTAAMPTPQTYHVAAEPAAPRQGVTPASRVAALGPSGKALPAKIPGVSLTARQEDVLGLLRGGKSNKEIALGLGLSEATVKVHVRQLMKKLGVSNRTQVALFAPKPQFAGLAGGAGTVGGSPH